MDFKEEYFDFEKFSIICKKCGSKDVEFGGAIENDTSGCYYPGEMGTTTGLIICKCHKCGNAFSSRVDDNDVDINLMESAFDKLA